MDTRTPTHPHSEDADEDDATFWTVFNSDERSRIMASVREYADRQRGIAPWIFPDWETTMFPGVYWPLVLERVELVEFADRARRMLPPIAPGVESSIPSTPHA